MMDWQLLVVAGIVAVAAASFVRRLVKQAKGKEKAGCDKCDG